MNSERLRGEFERRVLADTSHAIEHHVNELIDWLIDRDYRQWQAVMEFIERRSLQHTDQMIGQVRGEFDFNRQNLLKSIGRSAQEVVDSYDREAEALKLAKDVQRAIIQTAAVEAGAIGLGAILVVILNTTFLDVTGILGASALAALGLYVLPYRRQKVKAQLRTRISDLRRRLDATITHQFGFGVDGQRPTDSRGDCALHPLRARRAGEAGDAGRRFAARRRRVERAPPQRGRAGVRSEE